MNSDILPVKSSHPGESGNAMIYILIALALIAALTLALTRQNEQSDALGINDEKAAFFSTQLISYATTAQDSINKMLMSGSQVTDLDYVLPSASSFNTAPNIYKVFHPQGGGLVYKEANPDIFTGSSSDPAPGWYIGRFNNVEWTPTTANDIILTAHQISKPVCENLNKKITGSSTIPAIAGTGNLADYLIGDTNHSGSNAPFTVAVCSDCEGYSSLCVSNDSGDMWSYYVIIEGQ